MSHDHLPEGYEPDYNFDIDGTLVVSGWIFIGCSLATILLGIQTIEAAKQNSYEWSAVFGILAIAAACIAIKQIPGIKKATEAKQGIMPLKKKGKN